MNPPFTGYRPAAFTFLRALARNNRREWFEAHRDDYVHQVAEPTRALIEELDVRFATLAPEFVGDPKRSMFRIHRDVRFSKDKAPYKTHASRWIFRRHRGCGTSPSPSGSGTRTATCSRRHSWIWPCGTSPSCFPWRAG